MMTKHLEPIKAMLAKGIPVREIAAKLDISFQRVYAIMDRHNLPKPGYAPTDKVKTEILLLFKEGYSLPDMMEALSLTKNQILYVLWKNGLKVKDRGRSLVFTGKVPKDCKWTIGPRVWPSRTKAGYYSLVASKAITPKTGVYHLCTCACGSERILQKGSILSGQSKQCSSCAAHERFRSQRKQA